MPTVLPNGKIVNETPETPAEATPPPSTSLVGGPIEAAAAKTAEAVQVAADAHSTLANPAGMSGGAEVEVNVPGPRMPSGGDGPSFGDNYTKGVETLNQLQADGANDSLTNAPPEQLNPAKSGGGLGLMGAARYHTSELALGIRMEMEHTKDRDFAMQIAKDHLRELPDYYTRLRSMLKRAKAEHKKARKTKRHGRGRKRTHRRG